MKQPFLKSESAKKWTMFSFLVLSLGFNLSWNPNSTNIARNEVQVFELAQTAAPTNSKDEVVDLSEIDASIQMRLKIMRTEDAVFTQAERKISATEGTTVGCEKCRLEILKDSSGVNLKEVKNIKEIALHFIQKNQQYLREQTEKDKNKPEVSSSEKTDRDAKNGKNQFVAECRDKEDDEIVSCQLDAMKAATESCSKYDAACDKKVKAMWAPVKKYLVSCLNTQTSNKKYDFDENDCENAQDMAYEVIENLKNRSIQKDAVSLLEKKIVADVRAEQLRLKAQKVDIFTASRRLTGKMDSSVSSVGSQIWSSIRANEVFNSSNADLYSQMYQDEFGTPLMTVRGNLINDPLANSGNNLDSGTSGSETSATVSVARLRARQNGQAVPATPYMLDQNGRITNPSGPGLNNSGTSNTMVMVPGNGYTSPAQRGQLNPNTIRQ